MGNIVSLVEKAATEVSVTDASAMTNVFNLVSFISTFPKFEDSSSLIAENLLVSELRQLS